MALEIDTIILRGLASARPAAADALLYYATDTHVVSLSDGSSWADLFTSFARTLLDDAAASNARATLDLEPGTDIPSQSAFDDHSARHIDGGADEVLIEALATAETDDSLVLAPDGAGGVEFRAEVGGSGAELNYVEHTSPVSITSTTEASPDTVITSGSVSYDGSTTVLIEAFFPRINPSGTASAFMTVLLYEDSTSIGRIALEGNGANVSVINTYRSAHYARRRTPSAGSHTYSIRAIVSAGTGGFELGAGGANTYMPAFIRITRV